jgi:TfoX/Sxy family transcriptional regulator of competence genes
MPFDEVLADRVRQALGPRTDVVPMKMFGGVAFLLEGKMFVGVVRSDLMVRVGPDLFAGAVLGSGAWAPTRRTTPTPCSASRRTATA